MADVRESSARLRTAYGMRTFATNRHESGSEISVLIGAEDVRFLLTQALTADHAAASYVAKHGDGVSDISLSTSDVEAAHAAAVAGGARTISPPGSRDGATTATIEGFGDVTHTFVQRASDGRRGQLPGLAPQEVDDAGEVGLRSVDHFAVCLEPGHLEPTVRFYREALAFSVIFQERVVVGDQAMDSQVVQSAGGAVTLTLIAQDAEFAPGQIDQFIRNHDGPGVQHIALRTDDIVRTVNALKARGVEFLRTPDTYYDTINDRLSPQGCSIEDLRALDLLIDQDHDGQLLQIFARSTHPRQTYFTEIIQRMGATTFGSGNIKALYEAVSRHQGRS